MPKKENIEQMFDNIAPSYDKLNHILSLNIDKIWRRKAVRRVMDTHEALRVLDVACGTGDMTIETAHQMRKRRTEGHITGVDLSENMMSVGREKISKAGYSDLIELKQGNCEYLPFPDGGFDRVTAAFGVRNFEHIGVGLSEMHRVLATAGKVVILELSIPRNKLIARLYRVYFEHILPWVGKVISGDKPAYKYLPSSVLNFPAPEEFCKMLREAGFADVGHKALSLGICRMYVGSKK